MKKTHYIKFLLILSLPLISFSANAQECRADTVLTYEYIPDTEVKELKSRTIYGYDKNNYKISELRKSKDDISEFWNSSSKTLIEVDNLGNELKSTNFDWSTDINSWLPRNKYTKTFNEKNLTSFVNERWDADEEAWIKSNKYEYEYSNNNLSLKTHFQSPDNTSWKMVIKDLYEYDDQNRQTKHENQNYNHEPGTLRYARRDLTNYTDTSREFIQQFFFSATAEWTLSGRVHYRVENGLDKERIEYEWKEGAWKKLIK